MPKQADREANLKRWSGLAPGECVATRFSTFTLASRSWVELHPEGMGVQATDALLSALIEAIRARGWHYNLFSDETEPENEQPAAWHSASIYSHNFNVVPKWTAEKAEPCDALLSAYIQALEGAASAKTT